MSEFEHTGRVVRSNNLISLFYEFHDVDSYIAQNLYGGYGGDLPPNIR